MKLKKNIIKNNNIKKNTKEIKIVIIGAGISGMSCAEQLIEFSKKSNIKLSITILEKQEYLGGLAASFKHEDRFIPKYYHQIFSHDYTTQRYFEKFGLLNTLNWKKIKMGICVNKKTYDFTDPVSLLKFNYLSFLGRIRYGLFGAYVFTIMDPSKIPTDLDAKTWLNKFAGQEVTNKLFYNLYARNKFNVPLERISAKQFAYRLKAKEAMGTFGYPKVGLQKWIDAFEYHLKNNNIDIIRNAHISKINITEKKIIYNQKTESYDYLVSTIPLPIFMKISHGLSQEFLSKLRKIKYCPCVCVAFGTKKFLSKHYWLNLIQERTHTLFQHSRLFDGYGKENKVNWILRYGGSEEDLNLSEEEIKKKYLFIVKKYFPKSEITWSYVFKETYAEPVYDKDYAENMPALKYNKSDKIYFSGTGVSYPKIRNMNTALEIGINTAREVINDLNKN
ncbi:MAG: FAD-dependent oxidoreductase [Candidatus Woesearchaeota archaeon]|jgi:protoporphyrinogen oxidase